MCIDVAGSSREQSPDSDGNDDSDDGIGDGDGDEDDARVVIQPTDLFNNNNNSVIMEMREKSPHEFAASPRKSPTPDQDHSTANTPNPSPAKKRKRTGIVVPPKYMDLDSDDEMFNIDIPVKKPIVKKASPWPDKVNSKVTGDGSLKLMLDKSTHVNSKEKTVNSLHGCNTNSVDFSRKTLGVKIENVMLKAKSSNLLNAAAIEEDLRNMKKHKQKQDEAKRAAAEMEKDDANRQAVDTECSTKDVERINEKGDGMKKDIEDSVTKDLSHDKYEAETDTNEMNSDVEKETETKDTDNEDEIQREDSRKESNVGQKIKEFCDNVKDSAVEDTLVKADHKHSLDCKDNCKLQSRDCSGVGEFHMDTAFTAENKSDLTKNCSENSEQEDVCLKTDGDLCHEKDRVVGLKNDGDICREDSDVYREKDSDTCHEKDIGVFRKKDRDVCHEKGGDVCHELDSDICRKKASDFCHERDTDVCYKRDVCVELPRLAVKTKAQLKDYSMTIKNESPKKEKGSPKKVFTPKREITKKDLDTSEALDTKTQDFPSENEQPSVTEAFTNSPKKRNHSPVKESPRKRRASKTLRKDGKSVSPSPTRKSGDVSPSRDPNKFDKTKGESTSLSSRSSSPGVKETVTDVIKDRNTDVTREREIHVKSENYADVKDADIVGDSKTSIIKGTDRELKETETGVVQDKDLGVVKAETSVSNEKEITVEQSDVTKESELNIVPESVSDKGRVADDHKSNGDFCDRSHDSGIDMHLVERLHTDMDTIENDPKENNYKKGSSKASAKKTTIKTPITSTRKEQSNAGKISPKKTPIKTPKPPLRRKSPVRKPVNRSPKTSPRRGKVIAKGGKNVAKSKDKGKKDNVSEKNAEKLCSDDDDDAVPENVDDTMPILAREDEGDQDEPKQQPSVPEKTPQEAEDEQREVKKPPVTKRAKMSNLEMKILALKAKTEGLSAALNLNPEKKVDEDHPPNGLPINGLLDISKPKSNESKSLDCSVASDDKGSEKTHNEDISKDKCSEKTNKRDTKDTGLNKMDEGDTPKDKSSEK